MNYVLSIDIGYVNMGFCLYSNDSDKRIIKLDILNISEEIENKTFEIGTCDNAKRIIIIIDWIKDIMKEYNIYLIIVEKQVRSNIKCMLIHSSIMTLAYYLNIPFISYDPKNKFKYENIKYDSSKKEHKKISIRYACNILYNTGNDLNEIEKFDKKDDVADALCMAFMTVEEDEYIKKMIKNSMNF